MQMSSSCPIPASSDSNRYTVHGLLTRLGCEVLDLGVVCGEPALLAAPLSSRCNAARGDAPASSNEGEPGGRGSLRRNVEAGPDGA